MKRLNIVAVFDKDEKNCLMCKRMKNPYSGLYNFVGGKIENGEESINAAYRELNEETAICEQDIDLKHLMDISYYSADIILEVYYGTLNKNIVVKATENPLKWISLDNDFFDIHRFAGNGNIGHIILQIKNIKKKNN